MKKSAHGSVQIGTFGNAWQSCSRHEILSSHYLVVQILAACGARLKFNLPALCKARARPGGHTSNLTACSCLVDMCIGPSITVHCVSIYRSRSVTCPDDCAVCTWFWHQPKQQCHAVHLGSCMHAGQLIADGLVQQWGSIGGCRRRLTAA